MCFPFLIYRLGQKIKKKKKKLYTHKTEPNGSLKSFYIGKESASQISSLTVFLIISSTSLIHFQAVYTGYIAWSLSSTAVIYCKWVSFLTGSQTVSLAQQQWHWLDQLHSKPAAWSNII